jgi:glycosyltransferase involved in cell wall biosynthesis
LSAAGVNRSVCEDLAGQLRAAAWPALTTSHRKAKVSRLADMAWTCWSARHRYEVAQVDVFSGPAFCWAEVACWVLRRARKPYVLTLHGGGLPSFARRWPGRVNHLLRSARTVTAPSGYLGDAMRTFRDDLQVVPNALDTQAYPFVPRRRASPKLVWLRAFHEIYNPALAPRVLALLAREIPGAQLAMLGPDKQDGSLQRTQQVAVDLGVRQIVDMPGPVAKRGIPDRLNRADIFLNTAGIDNTPVSVLEAMLCGLCIVSTNVGGIPALLEDGYDALLVPPNDPQAMARAVRRIVAEPALAERLSRNARRKAEQFDWSRILPQWKTLLASAARPQLQ